MMKPLHGSAFRTRAPIHNGNRQPGLIHKSFKSNSRPKFALSVHNSLATRSDASGSQSSRHPPTAIASDLRIGELKKSSINVPRKISEEQILKFIYGCRFFALLGVSGSLVGSFLCFIKGSVFIASSFMEYFVRRGKVISTLIEAIDIYLIGTVMLVFGMGLYELFICNLDPSKTPSERSNLFGLFTLKERPRWLEIKSVNELKTKLGHVIVMILLVGFLEKSLNLMMNSPQDVLCFAASILVTSCGLYLLSRLKN